MRNNLRPCLIKSEKNKRETKRVSTSSVSIRRHNHKPSRRPINALFWTLVSFLTPFSVSMRHGLRAMNFAQQTSTNQKDAIVE